jgi:hypothetical protein
LQEVSVVARDVEHTGGAVLHEVAKITTVRTRRIPPPNSPVKLNSVTEGAPPDPMFPP